MQDDNTYNGWANYATWRVQLELVDDEVRNMLENDPQYFKGKDKFEIADELKDFVYEVIHADSNEESIAESYAMAFLDDVNWTELAEHALELIGEQDNEN